jgi:hypothetical protein
MFCVGKEFNHKLNYRGFNWCLYRYGSTVFSKTLVPNVSNYIQRHIPENHNLKLEFVLVTNSVTSSQFMFLRSNSNRSVYDLVALVSVPIRFFNECFACITFSHACYMKPVLCRGLNEIINLSVLSVLFAENGEVMSVSLCLCPYIRIIQSRTTCRSEYKNCKGGKKIEWRVWNEGLSMKLGPLFDPEEKIEYETENSDLIHCHRNALPSLM